MRLGILIFAIMFFSSYGDLLADDPLDELTGTEEWDREEEEKRRALMELQKKRLISEEYEKTRKRFSVMLDEWQRDLSGFQQTRRTVEDILFQEESKNYQQVNVKEKIPPKEVKHVKAKTMDVSIETGGPIIEKNRQTAPPTSRGTPTGAGVQLPTNVNTPPVAQPKQEVAPEPTAEEILKKQQGYFDDKGQFVDEELQKESKSKGEKNKDIDYDSP